MSILFAANQLTVIDAARAFLEAGVSIIPLKGKVCALKSWAMAQQYRASLEVLDRWHSDGLLDGVGVVCGKVSGNLVVLDFDSHEAVANFQLLFPDLQDTLIVSSGSRRGCHFYYRVDDLPASMLVKNHELRAKGMYVVAPPSVHPVSGNEYLVQHQREPMRLHHMEPVVRWIKSKRPAPLPAPQMSAIAAPHVGAGQSREAYFRDRYVETALRRQCGYVSVASEGNRNHQLYWSAHALGQLVGAGALERSRVETELLSVALSCGLTQSESMATIKSGIDRGTERPRRIPGPPAHKQK